MKPNLELELNPNLEPNLDLNPNPSPNPNWKASGIEPLSRNSIGPWASIQAQRSGERCERQHHFVPGENVAHATHHP